MAEAKKYAPYPPAVNLLESIRTLRERGYSGQVKPDILISMGVPEGNVYRVLAALKWLGLLEKDGSLTETMETLRHASTEQYPVILEGVVRNAYQEVFAFCDPVSDDRTRVDDAFRTFHPPVQRPKMVTTFLALCKEAGIISAGPDDSATPLKPKRKPTSVPRKVRPLIDRASIHTIVNGSVGAGTSKTISLRSGGQLTIAVSVDVIGMSTYDRDFVFKLIDKVNEYESIGSTVVP